MLNKAKANQIMSKVLKYSFDILVFCCLFIVFYLPPMFIIAGHNVNALYVVGMVSVIYLLYRFRWLKYAREKKNLYIVGGFCFLVGYSILLWFINHTPLSNMASPLLYLAVVLPFAFVVIEYGKKRSYQCNNYIDLFISVGVLQAIIGVLTMVFPPLKQLILNMMVKYGHGAVVTKMPHRMFGFSSLLTFSTPVLQSILAVCCFYRGIDKSRKYYIPMLLLIGTAMINARTSIIPFTIGIVLACIWELKQRGWRHVFRATYPLMLCVPVCVVMIIVLYFALPDTVKWVIDGFRELLAVLTGNFETVTISTLFDSSWWVLPPGKKLIMGIGQTIMYGYENVSEGISRINSDVGYINDLWYGGIIYAIACYGFFYFLFSRMVKSQVKILRFVGVLFMVIMPILNIKGIAFTMSSFTNFSVILAVMAINLKTREDSFDV